nr:LytR C-terminal domain-containing protein [Lachnospiraceae bacterium]
KKKDKDKTSADESDDSDDSDEAEEEEVIEDSKEKKILVLNGTDVAGLAASTKEKLENAGYSVGDVGDYDGESQESTRIIVKENGVGKDLKSFFASPKIEVGEVREGYDIEIVLGTTEGL